MRLGVVALISISICAAVSTARAQRRAEPEVDFWESVLTPHAAKIARLRAEGGALRNRAYQHYDAHQITEKTRYLLMALERFEQAAKLAPDRADVLRDFADAAHDAGEHDRAIPVYLRVIELSPDDRQFELHRRLAVSYTKTLRFDQAASVLERALGNENAVGFDRMPALGHLGYVYMAQGRLEDAIDAYTRATTAGASGPYGGGGEIPMLLGLAVAYDRDEQVGRSLEILEQVRQLDQTFSFLTSPYAGYGVYGQIPFAPPSDRHYWIALAYEAQKRWSEAAIEWRAYLDSHDPTYKRRAREHLSQVNAELAKKHKPKKKGEPRQP